MGGGGEVLSDSAADAAEEGEVWAGGGGEVGLFPRLDRGRLRELVLVFPRGVALGDAAAGGGGGAEALACGRVRGVVEAGVVGALPVAGAAAGGVECVGEEGGFEGGGAEDCAGVVEVGGGAGGGVGEHVAC